jgi:hypothetical protein
MWSDRMLWRCPELDLECQGLVALEQWCSLVTDTGMWMHPVMIRIAESLGACLAYKAYFYSPAIFRWLCFNYRNYSCQWNRKTREICRENVPLYSSVHENLAELQRTESFLFILKEKKKIPKLSFVLFDCSILLCFIYIILTIPSAHLSSINSVYSYELHVTDGST